MSSPEQTPHRSGFVALVGRPNAGKTTLTNALVGEKVGIVSNRPQTTRHAIRGVVHKPEGQIVLVDVEGWDGKSAGEDAKFTFRGSPKPAEVPDSPAPALAGAGEGSSESAAE